MKNEKVNIRKYVAEDKAAVEELMQKDQLYHIKGDPDLFVPVDYYFSDEFYDDLLDESPYFSYIAEFEGTIIGCIICLYDDVSSHDQIYQNNIMIAEIYVCDEYKRQGVATALFQEVRKKAEDECIDFITLDVYSFNASAKKFYQSVGMTVNREYMKMLITHKTDERVIAKQRYYIEHELLRDFFFEDKQEFVDSLSKEMIFSTYCHHFARHYDNHSFNYETKSHNDYKISILTLPKEKLHLLCRRIVYYYMDGFEDYGMMTVEYDKELSGYYLCEWQRTADGYEHINHGEIPDSEDAQLSKIKKLLEKRAKGIVNKGIISTELTEAQNESLVVVEGNIESVLDDNEIKYMKDADDGEDTYTFECDFNETVVFFVVTPHEDFIEFDSLIESGGCEHPSNELYEFMNYMNKLIRFVKFRSMKEGIILAYDYLFDEGDVSRDEIVEIIARLGRINESYQEYLKDVAEGRMTAAEAREIIEKE